VRQRVDSVSQGAAESVELVDDDGLHFAVEDGGLELFERWAVERVTRLAIDEVRRVSDAVTLEPAVNLATLACCILTDGTDADVDGDARHDEASWGLTRQGFWRRAWR